HCATDLAGLGVVRTRRLMCLARADFDARFHAVGAQTRGSLPLHHPTSYAASQALARELLQAGSNGVAYRSVRRSGGECIACFRPALVRNVRSAAHFEYSWEGSQKPVIHRL